MIKNCIRYVAHQTDRGTVSTALYAHKARQTYISPQKEAKTSQMKQTKAFSTSPGRFGKEEYSREKELPPSRGGPFQRSRNISIDKNQKERIQGRSINKQVQDNRREVVKFSSLKKKLQEEMCFRQKLQEMNARQQIKISNLEQEISKLRTQKKQLQRTILQMQKSNEEGKNQLNKANLTIEQLNKNMREVRINQKSFNNLKNLQNQLDYLQERNKKLTIQNQELSKNNKSLKIDFQKISRDGTAESMNSQSVGLPSFSSTTSLEAKMLNQMNFNKTEREKFLQGNLRQLEKKLYQKQNQMKKLHIQLNCIDRKKVMSIDEVKVKKDRQIKDLRQGFMKVTKDLRETKDRFQKTEKKQLNLKDSAFLRKVKSSKHFGIASESEQVTLQLSSQP